MQRGQEQRAMELVLPPGFRFFPTDEELLTCYLARKAMDGSFTTAAIREVDLYKTEPWDLPCTLRRSIIETTSSAILSSLLLINVSTQASSRRRRPEETCTRATSSAPGAASPRPAFVPAAPHSWATGSPRGRTSPCTAGLAASSSGRGRR